MSVIEEAFCLKKFEKCLRNQEVQKDEKSLFKGMLSVNEFMDIEDLKYLDKGLGSKIGIILARYPKRFGYEMRNDKRRNQTVKFWYRIKK